MEYLAKTLALLRERVEPDTARKIVCLSLPKTATTSFHKYLEDGAGLTVAGAGPTKKLDKFLPFVKACEARLKTADGFQEWPWCFFGELFKERYPNTKFVIFTRPFEDWFRSFSLHLGERERSQAVIERFMGVGPTAGEADYRAAYHTHYASVAKFAEDAAAITIALSEPDETKCVRLNAFLGFNVEKFGHELDHRGQIMSQVRRALMANDPAEALSIIARYREFYGRDKHSQRSERLVLEYQDENPSGSGSVPMQDEYAAVTGE